MTRSRCCACGVFTAPEDWDQDGMFYDSFIWSSSGCPRCSDIIEGTGFDRNWTNRTEIIVQMFEDGSDIMHCKGERRIRIGTLCPKCDRHLSSQEVGMGGGKTIRYRGFRNKGIGREICDDRFNGTPTKPSQNIW